MSGEQGQSHAVARSEPADIDIHSVVSIDDIERFFRIDWSGPGTDTVEVTTIPKSQSEPGYPLSHLVGSDTLGHRSTNPFHLSPTRSTLPSRLMSNLLMDPNMVLRALVK